MKKIILVFLVFVSVKAFAQQDALLNQYMFNKFLINPAYTGTQKSISAIAIHRNQWVSMKGAPVTNSFSLHSPISDFNMGIGGYVIDDRIGPLHDITLMGSYAYRINFQKAILSMGIQVGFKHSSMDNGKVDMYTPNDPNNIWGSEKSFIPDANLGLYLYGENYYLGASTRQLFNSRLGVLEKNGQNIYTKMDQHYYFMGGFVFPLTDNIMCRPSTLVKYVNNTDPNVDLNVSFLLNNLLWLGTSYRSGNQVAFLAELNINNQLSVGYSFDFPLSELGSYSYGTHEIMVSYNFNFYKRRQLNPRYF